MAKAATSAKSDEIVVLPISQSEMKVCILGVSPIIFHSMSLKVKQELLLPKGRKTNADKASTLKHNPLQEYRDSVNKDYSPDGPTRVMMPASALKGALMTAALDMPGTKKTEIGRLVTVTGERVPVWGIPTLKMDVVRSADINKTPDVRTRACAMSWCTEITTRFVTAKLTHQAIVNLLAAAGVLAGIGDFRQEKGRGSFGQFVVCNEDDPEFLRIKESGGRAAQDAALAEPQFYDGETEELYRWYEEEVVRRGRDAGSKPVKKAA